MPKLICHYIFYFGNVLKIRRNSAFNFPQESLQDGDAAQLEEIDEMISATERAQLAKYEHCSNKLQTAQTQVLETVFSLRLYLQSLPGNVVAAQSLQ